MRRLWPAFLCLGLLGLIGSRQPPAGPSIVTCWERDMAQGQETCYLCGTTVGYATDQARFVGAQYESWPNHWVTAYISICDRCVAQHGWPLPAEQQQQSLRNWQTIEIEYFEPFYQAKPKVWQRRLKQIESVRLAESPS